ncbi:MAG: BamA/TamA family outer membrane protein [Desulfovibrio sp.]|nr:BamA/TamA family outer membrane protein [Desulfovibrio sp.]
MKKPLVYSPRATKKAPDTLLGLLFVFFLLLQLTACGFLSKDTELRSEQEQAETDKAAQEHDPLSGQPIPYELKITVAGEHQELVPLMQAASSLHVFAAKPPDSLLGIESRARADTETAVKLLHSQCYYEGTASYELDENTKPVRVNLLLTPGPRYTLGHARVHYEPAPKIPPSFAKRVRSYGLFGLDQEELPGAEFPEELPDLEVGKPVIADAVLAAVENLQEKLVKKGYPLARVSAQHYTLNRELRELYADITVNPGPCATMGDVQIRGNEQVSSRYLASLKPWKTGEEPWDEEILEDYANELRHSGLFRSVVTKPMTESLAEGQAEPLVLPIEVVVKEAPFRTVGGNIHYDTSTGFGVEGSWEHRNIFGNGEKLAVTAPVATEEQGLKLSFEKPAFFSREQKLTAHAKALHEYTDAYERTGLSADLGVERRLTRTLTGGAGLFGETGILEETYNSQQNYTVYGPQFFLRHDSRDNTLNPTRGAVAKLTLKPFAGSYTEDFTGLAGTLGGNFYYAPFRDKNGAKSDKLVLAARVEGGMLTGTELHTLPSSMRYYTGGAGSVRGYVYQGIGPRDKEDKPEGGRSYQLVNLEARYKITDNVGIVPFVDGGMVYTSELPEIIGDMRWGGGLGLRYYTPIGPVRLDVATPFNPIEGDSPVQIYISIGQAF